MRADPDSEVRLQTPNPWDVATVIIDWRARVRHVLGLNMFLGGLGVAVAGRRVRAMVAAGFDPYLSFRGGTTDLQPDHSVPGGS